MNTFLRLAASIVLAVVLVVMLRQAAVALRPALPSDMPRYSSFVQSGYDLAQNEPKGEWIACNIEEDQTADFCRITDAHGVVIFEGDFLPVNSRNPVPAANLRYSATNRTEHWVRGPVEAGPVPVIPLADGQLLVPAADSVALADRWAKDPDELNRLSAP